MDGTANEEAEAAPVEALERTDQAMGRTDSERRAVVRRAGPRWMAGGGDVAAAVEAGRARRCEARPGTAAATDAEPGDAGAVPRAGGSAP